MFAFQGQFPGLSPFMPMPMPAPAPPSTSYKYVTPDGGPPMEGKVPTGSAFDKPNPFAPPSPFASGNCVPGAMHPFWPPTSASGPQFPWAPPPAPPCQMYRCSPMPPMTPPPPYAPQMSHCPPPPPPAPTATVPPGNEFYSTPQVEEPFEGNRVKGQLAKFENGAGYIFPRNNCTIHVFSENVVHKPSTTSGKFIRISNGNFRVQHAPCDMTFEELIQGLDCQKRANSHPPYNQPGHGYPENQIGIQEVIDWGNGWWEPSRKIMLGSPEAGAKIGQLWSGAEGTAGQAKPRYIVRCPV